MTTQKSSILRLFRIAARTYVGTKNNNVNLLALLLLLALLAGAAASCFQQYER
jgi:hypothetical protein